MSEAKVLVLRTCHEDMTSYNDFVWPKHGYVEAPDWEPTHECGYGLHGWLWGEGDGGLGNWDESAKWLVVEVDADKIIDLGGKVKFPSGNVIFCGNRKGATSFLVGKAPDKAVIGAEIAVGTSRRAVVGDYGDARAGDYGEAIAGNYGVAVAGIKSEATAGHGGRAVTGVYGMARAGVYGTAIVGDWGVAIASGYGIATAGNYGQAIAGNNGRATAGDYGTAIVGRGGEAMARKHGAVMAKEGSILRLRYDDTPLGVKTAYVGQDGILPNTLYKLDADRNFVKA